MNAEDLHAALRAVGCSEADADALAAAGPDALAGLLRSVLEGLPPTGSAADAQGRETLARAVRDLLT